MRKGHILLIIILVFFGQSLLAQIQRVTLSGTVKDAASGESLMGAYVILTDTLHPQDKQGCITNQAGFILAKFSAPFSKS